MPNFSALQQRDMIRRDFSLTASAEKDRQIPAPHRGRVSNSGRLSSTGDPTLFMQTGHRYAWTTSAHDGEAHQSLTRVADLPAQLQFHGERTETSGPAT